VRPGSRWTERRSKQSRGSVSLVQGMPGATGLQSSPGRRRATTQSRRGAHRSTSGGVVVRNNGGGSSSTRAQKIAGESSGMRGRGAGLAGGGAHPFVGAGGVTPYFSKKE
jgi:hypothetical protein